MDELLLLGRLEYRTASGSAVVITSSKAQALLAYIAMHPSRRIDRATLATLLWDEAPPSRARANLRKTLSRLRDTLTAAKATALLIDPQSVALDTANLKIDALDLVQQQSLATPDSQQRMLELTHGDFCQGMEPGGEVLTNWLETQRRHFREIVEQARISLAAHYLAIGAIDAAIEMSLGCLADDPLREDVHRDLMQLYLHQDRIGAALKQYRHCEAVLREELNASPGAQTQALLSSIQRKTPSGREAEQLTYESDTVPERADLLQSMARQRERYRAGLNVSPSIAVLAFADDDISERAGLGITFAEEIATTLGRFREIEVLAPSTAYAYRESALDWPSIGEELRVNYLCGGRILTVGGQLTLTARLLDARDGRQLWAERFETDRDNLFGLHDDVVARVATTLIGKIEVDRLKSANAMRPRDIKAYELWLRGRNALRQPGRSSLEEASRYFRQALERDPAYSRAHVGLAMTMLGEGACYRWNHWVFLKEEALALARKALTTDPDDAHAHCILGMTEFYRGRYDSALGRLRHAVGVNPNDPDVLAHAAVGLALLGEHATAVDAGRRALRITPHYPEWYAAFAGIALFAAREYREAIETMSTAPEALCNTAAFIAASYAYLGEEGRCDNYRATVWRHHKRQTERGDFPADTSCMDWLLALDPFRIESDLDHYATGLKRSGFDVER